VPYGSARLPHGNARQIEAEDALAQVRTEKGKASVQKEVFWSRDLLLFDAEGPGSKLDLPFDVAEPGRYELLVQAAHSPDYGRYRVLLDGKPLQPPGDLEPEPGANVGAGTLVDGYFTELYVAEDHVLGWPDLTQGRHTLTFLCAGKDSRSEAYRLGLDTLVLARVATPQGPGGPQAEKLRQGPLTREQWTAALLSADPGVRAAALWRASIDKTLAAAERPALEKALGDESSEVRGLAAVALRLLGPEAAPSAPVLARLLSDPDTGVRMTAASALAAIGPKSLPALPALLQACDATGEHVHVQRSLADALGAIGPPARDALPALCRFREIPRVRWNAEAAIAHIESGSAR
jgi:hypothetical protein